MTSSQANSATQKGKLIQETFQSYIAALLKGEKEVASQVVKRGLKAGLSLTDIYLKVLTPSQYHIGEKWFNKEISVSEEHLASQITLQQMDFLKHLIIPKSPLGVKAVVTTLEGDWHLLGARILADFLYEDGWEVDFLGASTPVEDLLQFLEKKCPDLLAISMTIEESLPHAKNLIHGAQKLKSVPKVMVGGLLFEQKPEFIQELKASGFASDAFSGIQEARRICNISSSPPSLQHFLKKLGERIQSLRKAKAMSQKELADASGLDRAYISSLEHGKQNVTIGAIIKLAEALGISLEEALIGSSYELNEREAPDPFSF